MHQHTSTMHPNHSFCLQAAKALAPGGKYLDYGCGAGQIVEAGLAEGLDIWGTELFYGGGDASEMVRAIGLLGTRILPLENNVIPFPDEHFDVVFHNMVFEHVEDLPTVLREIRRVLKPSGAMLSIFPTREVLREGHCGIPFAHYLNPDSRASYHYMLLMRRMGFGYFHGDKSPETWATEFLDWLKSWCYYRTSEEIRAEYSAAGLTVENYELPYILYRLEVTKRGWAKPIARALPGTATTLLQRLATRVIISRPSNASARPRQSAALSA